MIGLKVILASNNNGKLVEIQQILKPFGIEVISMKTAGVTSAPEETGNSFEENSMQKAAALARLVGCPVIADDSGLCVDALDGAPGVYSARFGEPDCKTDADRNQLLLQLMDSVPDANRTASFVCVISFLIPGEAPIIARGTCEGVIARSLSGTNGFGYDPLFYLPEYGKTMAEVESVIKNRISHRAAALRALQAMLQAHPAITYSLNK